MTTYRIYFNRLNEAPQVWSVDEGTQESEINVVSVTLLNCNAVTRVDLAETVNPDRPKVWFEVRGTMSVRGGIAVIEGGCGI